MNLFMLPPTVEKIVNVYYEKARLDGYKLDTKEGESQLRKRLEKLNLSKPLVDDIVEAIIKKYNDKKEGTP